MSTPETWNPNPTPDCPYCNQACETHHLFDNLLFVCHNKFCEFYLDTGKPHRGTTIEEFQTKSWDVKE